MNRNLSSGAAEQLTATRRTVLKLLAATAALGPSKAMTKGAAKGELPRRLLGKTGEHVSLLGLGGAHLSHYGNVAEELAVTMVRTAIDEGLTFMDNAWNYTQGLSEERMGKALADGYRDRAFVMTKEISRNPKVAIPRLEQSLRRLRTETIDLWQFHGIQSPDDPRRIYEDGLLEATLRVREQGKIRFIGFTGHFHPALHVEMIERGFAWDAMQMPINVVDPHYLSFVEEVLPVAVQKGIGVIAMKTMAGTPGTLAQRNVATAAECLRYAMSLPVSTVCSGIDSMSKLRRNIETVRQFEPLKEPEIEALLKRTASAGQDGQLEGYKSRS